MQTLAVCSDVQPSQTLCFHFSLNVSSSVWHLVFIATGAWYCRSLPRNKIRKLGKCVLRSVLLLHFYNVWKSFNLSFCFLLSIDRRNEHSSCRTWFKWERWCSKILCYPLHFLKPLEKAAIASLQSHKESIDISAHFSSVISVVLDQVFTVPHA